MPSSLFGEIGWTHYIIGVEFFNTKELSEHFLDYDTAYWDKKAGQTKHYPIDFKKAIVIFIFSWQKDDKNINRKLWTTIRRHTPKKFVYYQGLVGKEIEIEIEGMEE
jgi:hypothetical protein